MLETLNLLLRVLEKKGIGRWFLHSNVKDNDIHGSILSSVKCGSIDNFDVYPFMWNT